MFNPYTLITEVGTLDEVYKSIKNYYTFLKDKNISSSEIIVNKEFWQQNVLAT